MTTSDRTRPHRSSGPRAFARRHQLPLFFVLAYASSWWAWIWYQLDPDNVGAPILPLGPFLAALVMLALVGGWAATREWLEKIGHWWPGPLWYALVLLGPPALTSTAVAINLGVGAAATPDPPLPTGTDIAVQFVFILLWIGLGEEPAWRGYALPRLLAGRTALVAALMLGVLHALWHLPLFGVEYDLANGVPWAIGVLCVSVVITWIWLHTGGSLLLPMLLHASNNSVAFVWRWFTGTDQIRLWWIWAGLWTVTAVLVVVVEGPRMTRGAKARAASPMTVPRRAEREPAGEMLVRVCGLSAAVATGLTARQRDAASPPAPATRSAG